MKKIIIPFLTFLLISTVFLAETIEAFGIVAFHADFFEKKGTVIIDAGHGGEDGGAVGVGGIAEKDINLAIALELQKNLKQNNFEVIMIRDGDYAVGDTSLNTVSERKRSDLRKRLEIVEQTGDCILISIHQNHFSESKYWGAQIFYSENHENSKLLADCIRDNIISLLQPDNNRENKIADKNIYLLYNCYVPSALVECGFLSNPSEAEMLNTPEYQKSMANVIYNGLIDYFTNIRESESKKE